MIKIQGAKNLHGETIDIEIQGPDQTIHADHLTIFPGLIDPHVHFRTPGLEHKEDWRTAAKAAICGGYTTVFDMPNTLPPTISADLLKQKKDIINQQLQEAKIPLRYHLYIGADKNHLAEIEKVKNDVVGIKVFMGCSTGNLVIDDDESLAAVFEIAAKHNMLVAVHAEDESRLKQRKANIKSTNYADHSTIRDPEAAAIAVDKAIKLAKIYETKLYVLHASTIDELNLIRQAKQEGLKVYAETTPHHLFLDESFYEQLQGKAVVNPPLRNKAHRSAVFDAILDGTIDTIGSDHAPHSKHEKSLAYGQCPSGMPGIETTLPLLLEAYHSGLISLHKIVELTAHNPQMIFNLTSSQDYVLVDINKQQKIDESRLKTKCGWSAFAGRLLRGWPKYTIINGQCFDVDSL